MKKLKRLWCRIFGHDRDINPIVDAERRKTYNPCLRCGAELQYDFQKNIPLEWIGYCHAENKCPLCFGWKSKAWKMCGGTGCVLNPQRTGNDQN
jgi:hypothetical protein